MPALSPAAAGHLAYYGSVGLATLAPRGWHCIELYGSGGSFLLVTPRRYTADSASRFGTLAGPAVELQFLNGENSGRQDVARVFARLFPGKEDFVRQVIALGFEPARSFPRGPYPADATSRRSASQVTYTTPPRRNGMGTFDSRLRPGPDPINGIATVAASDGVDSVVLLNVRLPRAQRPLTPGILGSARSYLAK